MITPCVPAGMVVFWPLGNLDGLAITVQCEFSVVVQGSYPLRFIMPQKEKNDEIRITNDENNVE